MLDKYRMLDSAFPPASATDTKIQRQLVNFLVNFQGIAHMIKKRANGDYAATESDSIKARKQ
jgi:hypothetical protein